MTAQLAWCGLMVRDSLAGSMVEVYPVGLFHDLKWIRTHWRGRGWRVALWKARYATRRSRWWKRSYWNGFLAEAPDHWPATRAGHGWTPSRALRDLNQHMGFRK